MPPAAIDLDGLAGPLDEIARQPVLLVASDYDGTLAEIVDDPERALPHREALVALQNLALLPNTHVAIISGRSLDDLARLSGAPQSVHLVGSHGSEFDPGFAETLGRAASTRLAELTSTLRELAEHDPGFLVEPKPAGVAFHFRMAAPEVTDRILPAVRALAEADSELLVREGKMVVEFSVVSADKGRALSILRQRLGASAALFIGDDVTDEDAFRTLLGPDVAIKIGPGDSLAPHRLEGPLDAARLLAFLAELRAAWLAGGDAIPIERFSLLSDQRSMALVGPAAGVHWFCAPRVDSPPIFAELVGGEPAGYFRIRPLGEDAAPEQRYLEGSLVLETRWPELRVLDYLDCTGKRARRRAGRTDFLRVIEGRGRVQIEFGPRMDFGRHETRLARRAGGIEVVGSIDPIVLFAPGVDWEIRDEGAHDTAVGTVELSGEPLVLELRWGTAHLERFERSENERRLGTLGHWSRWLENLSPPKPYSDLVLQSALALKGLQYLPTGAFAAAATTSLPESLGGVRNWDYRYSWLRDSALAARALVGLGSHHEALAYLDWVLGVVERCEAPARLRPLYTVTGHEVGPEAEIAELAGYAGSRPVRVGNGAAQQVQLDVFGPIVDLIAALVDRGAPISSEHWRLVRACVEAVSLRWREHDHGIWEIRKPQRHHVHSKTMCWVTVDRALRIAPHFESADQSEWRALAREIREDVLARGWNAERESFTAAYDGDDLDAAALLVGLTGLVEPDDPRFAQTIRAIERELRDGPVVYRYRSDDGLPGDEGGFHLCTAWLAQAYLATGRRDDARELFEAMLTLVGPTGMMPEEWCPSLRRSLGNHPQAYSHVGLIEVALALEA